MGSGSYSTESRALRAERAGYSTKSIHEIFDRKFINNAMSPYGVKMRESRDSEEHPNSLAIVLALDVTGSMGSVPHHLVKDGLPNIMDGIIKKGEKDPQVLFLGIGDHEVDKSPLQVGQFESSDELLDHWLTNIFLEEGGGSNEGESYLLAWYLAGFRTSIHCYEKRKRKGFLFTIGDEPTLKTVPGGVMKQIMGEGQYENFTSLQLLDKARETYNVYHLHMTETGSGSRISVQNEWKQIMGDNLILVKSHLDVARIIQDIVTSGSQNQKNESHGKEAEEKEEEIL